NLRGLRESVMVLVPIFVAFAATHLIVVVGGLIAKLPEFGSTFGTMGHDFQTALHTPSFGLAGMLLLFLHAYSLGGGTYTGIEAVANGLMVLRDPRVANGKRTMAYMAASLAFTAAGLLVLYLLWGVTKVPGKTMNASLVQMMTGNIPGGAVFAFITLL